MKLGPVTSKKTNNLLLIAAGILIGLGAGLILFFTFGQGRMLLNQIFFHSISPNVPSLDAPALDFQLQSISGTPVTLSDLKGETVLLNFWATWCGPCQIEMPLLQAAQDRYPDQLVVLAINNDESPAIIQSFIDKLGLKLTILLDPGAEVTQNYRVRGFPTTIMIDGQGVMRYQHVGELNQEMLAGYLKDLGVAK